MSLGKRVRIDPTHINTQHEIGTLGYKIYLMNRANRRYRQGLADLAYYRTQCVDMMADAIKDYGNYALDAKYLIKMNKSRFDEDFSAVGDYNRLTDEILDPPTVQPTANIGKVRCSRCNSLLYGIHHTDDSVDLLCPYCDLYLADKPMWDEKLTSDLRMKGLDLALDILDAIPGPESFSTEDSWVDVIIREAKLANALLDRIKEANR